MLHVDQERNCIDFGRAGESLVKTLMIDVSPWREIWPDSVYAVKVRRNGDFEAYPVSLTYDETGTILMVPITSTETEIPGTGQLEVIAFQGTTIVKSAIWSFYVSPAIDSCDALPAGDKWIDDVIKAGAEAVFAAKVACEAAEKSGYFYLELDDQGHLIYYWTENVTEFSFAIENGHLIFTLEEVV